MHVSRAVIEDLLVSHPIIAAVRDEQGLDAALRSPVSVIFLLDLALSNFKERVAKVKSEGKLAFVHMEMISGLSNDQEALEHIKREADPHGVITTKAGSVQAARGLGLVTIQRLFIIDSHSIETGVKMAQSARPDFIEIMPGIIPKVVPEIKKRCNCPVICGGMVSAKSEIISLLGAGAVAVSTSREELWTL